MAKVEMYTRRFCGYCDAARSLLKRKGVTFSEYDVTGDPELRRKMIARSNGGMTLPQIFIGDTHVGGCDDLYDLDAAGRLDPMLQQVGQGQSA
jgi:glutaredoxin 3